MSVSVLSSNVRVTGSPVIYLPNFIGLGGIQVFLSGTTVFFSGERSSSVTNTFATLQVTNNFVVTTGLYRYAWSGVIDSTGTLPSPVGQYSGTEIYFKNKTNSFNLTLSGNVDNMQNAVVGPLSNFIVWSDGQTWNRE